MRTGFLNCLEYFVTENLFITLKYAVETTLKVLAQFLPGFLVNIIKHFVKPNTVDEKIEHLLQEVFNQLQKLIIKSNDFHTIKKY